MSKLFPQTRRGYVLNCVTAFIVRKSTHSIFRLPIQGFLGTRITGDDHGDELSSITPFLNIFWTWFSVYYLRANVTLYGGFLIGFAFPVTFLCSTKSVPRKSLVLSSWKTCLYFSKIGSITDLSARDKFPNLSCKYCLNELSFTTIFTLRHVFSVLLKFEIPSSIGATMLAEVSSATPSMVPFGNSVSSWLKFTTLTCTWTLHCLLLSWSSRDLTETIASCCCLARSISANTWVSPRATETPSSGSWAGSTHLPDVSVSLSFPQLFDSGGYLDRSCCSDHPWFDFFQVKFKVVLCPCTCFPFVSHPLGCVLRDWVGPSAWWKLSATQPTFYLGAFYDHNCACCWRLFVNPTVTSPNSNWHSFQRKSIPRIPSASIGSEQTLNWWQNSQSLSLNFTTCVPCISDYLLRQKVISWWGLPHLNTL